MAVKLNKTSHYPIMVRTSKPTADGGQDVRRTRFHSADAATVATQARLNSGSTLEYIGYVTDPK